MTTLREAAEKSLAFMNRVTHWEEGKPDLHDMKVMLRAVLAAEQEQAYTDLLTYGTSVMKDGKRIDPKTLYIDSKTNTCTDCGKPLGSKEDIHTCSPQVVK